MPRRLLNMLKNFRIPYTPKDLGISRRLWLLVLIPIAFLLNLDAQKFPALAEWYAKGWYSSLSLAVNGLTRKVPFSLAEVLLAALLLLICIYLVCFVWILYKKKGERHIVAAKFVANVLCFGSIVYFLFVFTCGINYSRYTFAQTSGLLVKPSSKAELVQLCTSLAADVNRTRGQVKTDKNSLMTLHAGGFAYASEEARQSYDKLGADYPLLKPGYGAPKPVLFSDVMSRLDITGIFVPFTFEANVNYKAPAYTIPATMCHELSHLRGYMREDEANFIAYLACLKSDDPDFQYSGDMLAFTYASNALYAKDQKAANTIFATLDTGVKKDLSYDSQYWAQFEGPVSKVSNTVNNQFLKANNQNDGIQSYGRMVDLLLARQRSIQAKAKEE